MPPQSRRRILGLVLIGIGIYLLAKPETSIDRADFLRIQPGMSHADVVRILRAGDYREARYLIAWHKWSTDAWGKIADERCVWYANLATIQICFGPDDKVAAGTCFVPQDLDVAPPKELVDFLDWLGLPKVRE